MPADQRCGECRQRGHNRTTCPVLNTRYRTEKAQLEGLVREATRQNAIGAQQLAQCQSLVLELTEVIRAQRIDLELETVINGALRDEIDRKNREITQLRNELNRLRA